jgi:hypothetical protein
MTIGAKGETGMAELVPGVNCSYQCGACSAEAQGVSTDEVHMEVDFKAELSACQVSLEQHVETVEALRADLDREKALRESAEAKLAAVRRIQAWSPCPAEPEGDDDGPLYQGFITDPGGTWVKVEDLVAILNAPSQGEAQFRCGSCRDTGKWSTGSVCPACGGISVDPSQGEGGGGNG